MTVAKNFIFKGLISCQNCGCSITPQRVVKKSGKVFTYYSCTNAKNICKKLYTPEKELLKPIYEVLDQFSNISQETQEILVEELRKETETEVIYHKAQIDRIRKEYDRIKEKDNRLLDLYTEPDTSITKDIYDKKHQEHQDVLQVLGIEMSEHERADYDYQTTVATVVSLARRAKEIFESSEPEEKRTILNYLLQNPTVKGKTLGFTLRSPFNLVLELANRPSWLPG